MARDLSLGVPQLASPNQAARLFNPGGQHPVRQKHLFVVRFLRETQSTDADWNNPLTFVVKSMDRPSVQAVTEEINQYNRKRVIHTGIKYQPVNCSLYDTADGAAMNMWLQYAQYYFGDYNHEQTDYLDDIIDSDIRDSSKSGYGFTIRPTSTASIEGANTQHFFSRVEVYQVWGNEYTRYDLINPRINTFTPDDLNYETADASTIQMTLSYEAISHSNTGRPQDLFSDSTLTTLFSSGPYRGEAIEVSGYTKTVSFTGSAPIANSGRSLVGSATDPVNSGTGVIAFTEESSDEIERTNTSSEGGVLSRFGNWDFGSTQSGQFDGLNLPQAIGGSQNLANLLSGNFAGGAARFTDRVSGSNSVEAAVGRLALENVDGLVEGVVNASRATGLDPSDHATRDGGLRLSNVALAGTNRNRDGTSQIGHRSSSSLGIDSYDI